MNEFKDLQALNQSRLYFLKQANKYSQEDYQHTQFLKKSHTLSVDIYDYFEREGYTLSYQKPNHILNAPAFKKVDSINILHYMALTDNFYCLDKLISKVDEKTIQKLLSQNEDGFLQTGDYYRKTPLEMIVIKKAYHSLKKLDEKFNVINEENLPGIVTHLFVQSDSSLGQSGQALFQSIIQKPIFTSYLQKLLNQKIKNTYSSSFGNTDYYTLLEDTMGRIVSASSFNAFSKALNNQKNEELLQAILEQRFMNTLKLTSTVSYKTSQIPLLSDSTLESRLFSIMQFYKNEFNVEINLDSLQQKDKHIIQKMYDFAYKTPNFYYATEQLFDYSQLDHEGNNFINYIFKQLGKYVPSTDIQQDLVLNLIQNKKFDLNQTIQKPKFHYKNVKIALDSILKYSPITEFPPLNRFKILLEKVLITDAIDAQSNNVEVARKRMKI